MTVAGECKADLPHPEEIIYAVLRLQTTYPEDAIEVLSPHLLSSAVETAAYAFMFSDGECRMRILRAIATLSFELVKLHPLTDGNKRLSTLVLIASLKINNLPLPPPGIAYKFALETASEDVDVEKALAILRRILESG